MTDGKELRDFISVGEASKKILQACNFKIKNDSFPQIWHIASGRAVTVKSFAKKNGKNLVLKEKFFLVK